MTHISVAEHGSLRVEHPDGWFLVDPSDFNHRHEGYWNSRVLAFVDDKDRFSDGVPVAAYEEFDWKWICKD